MYNKMLHVYFCPGSDNPTGKYQYKSRVRGCLPLAGAPAPPVTAGGTVGTPTSLAKSTRVTLLGEC